MYEYYTIALIAILAAISPGPDFVVVAKHAITNSRTSAVLASLGIGAGILIHTTYCVLGFAIIISQSLLLFSIIKYLGAGYLIYLGLKSLLSQQSHLPKMTGRPKHSTYFQSFRDGFLTNVLNPKCTLFMLSVFTLVIKPHTPTLIQASYGVLISLITTTWFIFLAYGFTIQSIKVKIENIQHIADKIIGIVLMVLGIAVLFESR